MIGSLAAIVKHKVSHHFDSEAQEFEAAKLGMWIFIGQEILFFSALFVVYAVFRLLHPEMFVDAHHQLDWRMGLLNTVILITSSFTMVMAVRAAQVDKRRLSVYFLILTFIFAGLFLVVKYFEYTEKIHHGFVPGRWFTGEGQFDTMHLFFGIYFCITGLHGIHILVGMGLIAWLIRRSYKGHFYSGYYTPLEMVGLYWHLVDIIWIFLFPLFYLIG